MCVLGLGPLFGMASGAAGAAAGAAGAAGALQTLGTIVSIGGTIAGGMSGMQAAKSTAAQIEEQRRTEAALTSVQDQRQRSRMMAEIATQRAELAARGVAMDSVTALQLGQTAAQEMSFESQATRSAGAARDQDLTAQARAARAQARRSLLQGGLSAVGTLIEAAPDIWPGLRGS